MFTKNLFVVAILAALGFSMSAAQARDFDHRDGYQASHRVDQRENFRHERRFERHHGFNHRHHRHHGYR